MPLLLQTVAAVSVINLLLLGASANQATASFLSISCLQRTQHQQGHMGNSYMSYVT
jgi:hypothetical protein